MNPLSYSFFSKLFPYTKEAFPVPNDDKRPFGTGEAPFLYRFRNKVLLQILQHPLHHDLGGDDAVGGLRDHDAARRINHFVGHDHIPSHRKRSA